MRPRSEQIVLASGREPGRVLVVSADAEAADVQPGRAVLGARRMITLAPVPEMDEEQVLHLAPLDARNLARALLRAADELEVTDEEEEHA
jgi:hypothetical protein